MMVFICVILTFRAFSQGLNTFKVSEVWITFYWMFSTLHFVLTLIDTKDGLKKLAKIWSQTMIIRLQLIYQFFINSQRSVNIKIRIKTRHTITTRDATDNCLAGYRIFGLITGQKSCIRPQNIRPARRYLHFSLAAGASCMFLPVTYWLNVNHMNIKLSFYLFGNTCFILLRISIR